MQCGGQREFKTFGRPEGQEGKEGFITIIMNYSMNINEGQVGHGGQ